MRIALTILVLTVGTATASRAQTAARGGAPEVGARDPRGLYDFSVKMPDMALTGRMQIKGDSARLEGTLAVDLPGEEPIATDSIVASGGRLHVVFTTGQGKAAFDLVPAGDSLVGKLSGAVGAGEISAKKVR